MWIEMVRTESENKEEQGGGSMRSRSVKKVHYNNNCISILIGAFNISKQENCMVRARIFVDGANLRSYLDKCFKQFVGVERYE